MNSLKRLILITGLLVAGISVAAIAQPTAPAQGQGKPAKIVMDPVRRVEPIEVDIVEPMEPLVPIEIEIKLDALDVRLEAMEESLEAMETDVEEIMREAMETAMESVEEALESIEVNVDVDRHHQKHFDKRKDLIKIKDNDKDRQKEKAKGLKKINQ